MLSIRRLALRRDRGWKWNHITPYICDQEETAPRFPSTWMEDILDSPRSNPRADPVPNNLDRAVVEPFSETANSQDENQMKALEVRGEDTEKIRRHYLLTRFWQTATAFWSRRRGNRIAWILSPVLLFVVLLNTVASYGMNLWNRAIFDAIEKKEPDTVLLLSVVYFAILLGSVGVGVAQVYARMTFQRRWRKWLTDNLVDRWLTAGRYYQLNLVSGDHKNPEYRIADDVRIATESPVDFVTGVTAASLSAATFIVVLWTIGGALSLTIAGIHIYIPGFLVIAAVTYALVASGAMVLIGRRFVAVSEDKNQSEAELGGRPDRPVRGR